MTNKKKSPTGAELRDKGIKQSIDTANESVENWSKLAYDFLLKYIKTHKRFMVEEMRIASLGIVPIPPSNRAWGGIVVRAKGNGLIYSAGTRTVKNPKAHHANANYWKTV